MERRTPGPLVLAAAGFALLAALVWAVAFETGHGVRLDARALHDFMDIGYGRGRPVAQAAARLGDPVPYTILTAGLLWWTLRREGPRVALTILVVLLGAILTAEVLKQLTADPRGIELVPFGHVSDAAWPSGHTTAATALALCAVWVAPPRLRPYAAIAGALYAIAVGSSVLLLGWHFPSDVIGGFCVAAAWVLGGIAYAGYPRPT
jgi:membrane-associated phospholipid phosphatase